MRHSSSYGSVPAETDTHIGHCAPACDNRRGTPYAGEDRNLADEVRLAQRGELCLEVAAENVHGTRLYEKH